MYVLVGVKYSLCGMYEAVCQEGRVDKRGSRWTASSLLYCVQTCSLFLSLSVVPHSLFFSHVFLISLLVFQPLFSLSFPLCCVVADGSRAAAATEQKPEYEQEMGEEKGVVERRVGERRWGSGIWRAWLRGPLRGSVHVRVVV